MRPGQWTKNGIVVAPTLFALGDQTQSLGPSIWKHSALAFLAFCLVSSATYVMNDYQDRELDRLHPVKRFRPLASGALGTRAAAVLFASALAGSILCALLLPLPFIHLLLAYFVLQIAYSGGLKKVAVLDVILIATGFVLRASAGAVALPVHVSGWLLLCTFLLAVFLGLGKRRHEKVTLQDLKDQARPSLRNYSESLLDRGIWTAMAAIVAAYLAYTLSPGTVEKFGSHRMVWTVPFVIAGVLRYHRLIYKHERGGRPEHVLLTDPGILMILMGYGGAVLGLFFLGR